MSERLVDAYDAALFDLDGVVYLGPEPVPGAPDGLAALGDLGVRIGFVTNNAARSPQTVVDQLVSMNIRAGVDDVVVSSQAGARLLAERVPAGSKVLVVGTDALAEQVRLVGFEVVSSQREHPVAVIQGYHPDLPWHLLEEAGFALQNGAIWVATNPDLTRPTDRGLVPGCGASIAALRTVASDDPIVAGKPFKPLMEETIIRTEAKRAIFVGDRTDTDVRGAIAVGIDSLLVFTGAHGKADLVDTEDRPTHIGYDLRALLEPPRRCVSDGARFSCGAARVEVRGNEVSLVEFGDSREDQLDALWAVLQARWGSTAPLNVAEALTRLDQIP